jgi:O-methyltransferase
MDAHDARPGLQQRRLRSDLPLKMRAKLVRGAVRASKAIGLARLVRAIARRLPARFQVRLAARVYELNRSAGDATAHVAADELQARIEEALRLLREQTGRDRVGDYLEFGVYAGGTMSCFERVRKELELDGVRLFGFDSFQGLPAQADEEAPDRFQPGMFRCTAEEARENLRKAGVDLDRVRLVEGWFEDTLTEEVRRRYAIQRAGVIMLDCDLYSSARAALRFAAPLVEDAAVVICDDWVHGGPDGEQRAFREFLQETGLSAEPVGQYQAGGHEDGGRVFLVTREQLAA